MSEPSTSDSNWNHKESSAEATSSKFASGPLLLSTFPWPAMCSPKDTINFLNTSLSRQSPLTPTTPTYCQTSTANSYPSVTSTSALLQPDSPSSMDDYPEYVAGSADEDTAHQVEIREKSYKNTERNRKSFTIDAILGLEDLAASLTSKGNSSARLPTSSSIGIARSLTLFCFRSKLCFDIRSVTW